MKAFFALAALATAVAAFPQSSTECEAQNIVEACLPSIQVRIDACGTNDWRCMCETYQQLLTCYDNCPNDDRKPAVQSQVTSFCAAAAQYATTTAAPVSQTSTPTLNADSSAASAPSSTQAAPLAEGTGAAVAVGAPAGAVMMALIGLAGLM